jgi:UDP-N-acetylglucosamine--N-acetylmuramyl-(pentapeptide) pyrophosphoryl-undecaprenol N-acetylglucosamine transferase
MAKIVITGGHHNSALVVAQYFLSKDHQVLWYGHRYSSRGDTNDSAEYIEVKANKIPFYDLPAGRLILDFVEILKIPRGILTAFNLLRRHKPDAILTFGGYLGAATAIAGALLSIPIYLHEQTIVTGRANKLTANFAKRIYLTWESSRVFFPRHKTMLVGLPLRSSILNTSPVKLFSRRRPTLLVMGGKLGASVINQFIFSHLNSLLINFNIVHQTGTTSLTHDYEHAISLKESLGSLADCYLPIGYISEDQIGKYLSSAEIYVGRSGAHICYELLHLSLKAILIPLATTHKREQYRNANVLVDSDLGLILPQSDLSYPNFIKLINDLPSLKPKNIKLPQNAAEAIYHDLLQI